MISAFFCLWLIASLAIHISPIMRGKIRRYDRWGLIPLWFYFVDNASQKEFWVGRQNLETVGNHWQVLLPPQPQPSSLRALWNPNRLDAKASTDVMFLTFERADEKARRILSDFLCKQGWIDDSGAEKWVVFQKDNLNSTEIILEVHLQ